MGSPARVTKRYGLRRRPRICGRTSLQVGEHALARVAADRHGALLAALADDGEVAGLELDLADAAARPPPRRAARRRRRARSSPRRAGRARSSALDARAACRPPRGPRLCGSRRPRRGRRSSRLGSAVEHALAHQEGEQAAHARRGRGRGCAPRARGAARRPRKLTMWPGSTAAGRVDALPLEELHQRRAVAPVGGQRVRRQSRARPPGRCR